MDKIDTYGTPQLISEAKFLWTMEEVLGGPEGQIVLGRMIKTDVIT